MRRSFAVGYLGAAIFQISRAQAAGKKTAMEPILEGAGPTPPSGKCFLCPHELDVPFPHGLLLPKMIRSTLPHPHIVFLDFDKEDPLRSARRLKSKNSDSPAIATF